MGWYRTCCADKSYGVHWVRLHGTWGFCPYFLYMKYFSLHHLQRLKWDGWSLVALNLIWEASNKGTSIGACHFLFAPITISPFLRAKGFLLSTWESILRILCSWNSVKGVLPPSSANMSAVPVIKLVDSLRIYDLLSNAHISWASRICTIIIYSL